MCSCIAHDNCVCCAVVPWGCLYPSFYIQGRRGYKEGNRVGYNMILIRTPSLHAYFTYISLDIIIYALWSMPWSSGIFRMVGRVIMDPSLGLPSPCEVVPWVLILITRAPALEVDNTIAGRLEDLAGLAGD
jgi:hypothetical protein